MLRKGIILLYDMHPSKCACIVQYGLCCVCCKVLNHPLCNLVLPLCVFCVWPSQEGAKSCVFGSDKRYPGYNVAVVPAATQWVLCWGDLSFVFQWDAALMPIRTTWMACTPLSRTVHEYFPFQQTSFTCTRKYMHAYIHTFICRYLHTYVCMYIYIPPYIWMYIYIYIHKHTHAHTYICTHSYLYLIGKGVSEDESMSNFVLCNLASKYVV